MERNSKESQIVFRIEKQRKEIWKKLCSERKISVTSLIVDSVEKRIFDDERRKIFLFIEKQDNVFRKVETNINQLAKIVNGQKFITQTQFNAFREQMKIVADLKKEQNEIFNQIYSLIAGDR
ncbi:hypothetical protein [Chryseobacterium sp. CFBP8996]|uniref:hypothetical protein n=1 Tax=Chryseobacterium sp. CFBP8996 TaxID=3096529 RepID=UPI002A6B4646|nr:hypothetical protein [Chryseobacterium sp. CFBP8996]MDY0930712.1 hypothetical protein [Chryseobacterium sp. CFBP8996]